MKLFTFSTIIFFLFQTLSQAKVVELKDGRKVDLKQDGTYEILNLTKSSLFPSVKIAGRYLKTHTTKFEQKSIRYIPIFKNESKKSIVGIKFQVDFKNAFGDSILGAPFSGTIEQIIEPGTESNSELFYNFKDNPFIPDQVYDKLLPSVIGGTLKDEVEIKQVVFKDG